MVMALAPGSHLLHLPASEHHPHAPPGISSACLGSGAGSYTPFLSLLPPPFSSLRRSSRFVALAKIVEAENRQHIDKEPPGNPRDLSNGSQEPSTSLPSLHAPWEGLPVEDFGSTLAERDSANPYRPAPWQQGEREQKNTEGVKKERPGEGDRQAAEDMSAMARIVEKLRSIQQSFELPEKAGPGRGSLAGRTAGELFLPKPNQDLFSIRKGWSTPDHPVPEPGRDIMDTKFPWERDEELEAQERAEKGKRVKPPTLAELTIPPDELRRLREAALKVQVRIKIGRLGVTDGIVQGIRERWQTSELVRVKCDGPAALNMKKTHQDLERKTGGLVVWRSGSSAVIYRGSDYDREHGGPTPLTKKLEGLLSPENRQKAVSKDSLHEATKSGRVVQRENVPSVKSLHEPQRCDSDSSDAKPTESIEADAEEDSTDATEQERESQIVEAIRRLNVEPDPFVNRDHEMEIESILEGLGPRFHDWTGLKPIPVDADLLPAVVPNFRPPYRLLPYGVKPSLSNAELTNLRRLARPLAPHFVLGRNKGNQGLAAAMVKLWEKTEIAKVAVKRGVQNTSNERMAEEIKRLTGGVLLSRDKFFITFYRGKDFLPQQVAAVLSEREAMVRSLQEEEERAREDRSIAVARESPIQPSVAVTMEAAPDVKPSWVLTMDMEEQNRLKKEATKARRLALARQMERKLLLAVRKKAKAEQDLAKVEAFLKPINRPVDTETITEEERFMFRRLGLKTKAFLLLGRRGVFDGVIENMHLHWKHRELVKIIYKERNSRQIQDTARILESESGGILVAIVPTSKGQAMIYYRGKNYRRPAELRPRNLLTKRKALQRSLEIQRQASLSQHIQTLEQEIAKLKAGLSDVGQLEDDTSSLQMEHDMESLLLDEDVEDDSLLGNVGKEEATISESERSSETHLEKMRKLEKLVRLGPIFRADPLTNVERLKLRKEALSMGSVSQFHVGKSNMMSGLARAIRVYFLHHALVKIGVKGRGRGTSLQDLVSELENLTGGVLVSQENCKIIMYRGWPEGEDIPSRENLEELSPELRAALEAEEEWDDDVFDNHLFTGSKSEYPDSGNDEGRNYSTGMLSDEDSQAKLKIDEEDLEAQTDEDEEDDFGARYDLDAGETDEDNEDESEFQIDEYEDYELSTQYVLDGGDTDEDDDKGIISSLHLNETVQVNGMQK